uniref:Uncharacterized protein n=1 Tax=Pararge aegeria TaxID=116150 RepID=S4PBT5_9NEOP
MTKKKRYPQVLEIELRDHIYQRVEDDRLAVVQDRHRRHHRNRRGPGRSGRSARSTHCARVPRHGYTPTVTTPNLNLTTLSSRWYQTKRG